MRQMMLKLTPEELIRTLQGKSTQQFNLPIDTELIGIRYNVFTKQVTAILRSDNFEDVAEDTPISIFIPKTASLITQQPQITTPTTIISENILDVTPTEPLENQADPILQQKPLIQTLTTNSSSNTSISVGVKMLGSKPDVNMDTCGFEDEFTKEQRKLLKFTSDDEFVFVKPIQFLKTEWEDINDTVKSIGGKWVKGGTIDYWAIPKNIKRDE